MSVNKAGYAQIFSSHENGLAHNVYIPESQKASWIAIKAGHTGNYYETTLLRAVLRLAVGDKTVAPRATIGEFDFSYNTSADRKDIFIHLISTNCTGSVSSKTPGVYRTDWHKDRWIIPTNSMPGTRMDLEHKWSDGTHIAAISGKFDSKEDAGEMMGIHIEKAYFAGNNARTQARQQGNHYSLFWLNNEFTSKEHIQTLVSLIQQAQKKDAKMKWLIHGEGCGTFVQALRFIKANPVASDIITAQKGMAAQDIYFSNPRGRHTAKKDLEAICKSVGMNFVNVNLNKHDVLFNPDARRNAIKNTGHALNAAGTAIAAGGLTNYLLSVFGIDTLKSLYELAASNPELTAGTALIATGKVLTIIGKMDEFSAFDRNIRGAASSTFRQGNQNWAA